MESTGGKDECLLNGTNLPFRDFSSYISSVCHLALPNAVDESVIEWQASGFLAKCVLDGSQKIVVVTNNHFVANKEDASRVLATFQFDGDNNVTPKVINLHPEIFFQTNQNPDYTFVGISKQDVKDLRESCHVLPVKLTQTRFTVKVNVDVIHIVQHPDGRQKTLSYSPICGINKSEVFYTADTSSGSSGSPVLYCQNNKMHVLALHTQGEVTLCDGRKANKGILVSAILDDICGVTSDKTQKNYDVPFQGTTKEIIRIAGEICDCWEIVAKQTGKFESWEISNIKLDITVSSPQLEADRMLTNFKSRLGSREVLAEAIKMSGKDVVAERVLSGYYNNY